MRMLSLLVTLLIVAYLVYSQLGGGDPVAQAPYKEAEAKATAVDAQVQAQFAQQAEALSHVEQGEVAPAASTSAP